GAMWSVYVVSLRPASTQDGLHAHDARDVSDEAERTDPEASWPTGPARPDGRGTGPAADHSGRGTAGDGPPGGPRRQRGAAPAARTGQAARPGARGCSPGPPGGTGGAGGTAAAGRRHRQAGLRPRRLAVRAG